MQFTRHHHKFHALSFALLLASAVLAVSAAWTPKSLADFNHNPHGVINYCTLSDSTTIIHGWAHDPDTPNGTNPTVTITVAGHSVTSKTSIPGYHDSAINKYLETNWPGAPTGSIYGFTASFSGLYKGTSYAVSGVVHNSGAGSTNQNTLKVDTSSGQTDGIKVSNLLTSGKTLPDACLNTKPAPPPPAPTPAPTPPPSGGSSQPPSGSSSGSTSSKSPTAPAPAAATSPADATVAAGTLNAVITAPSDGATTVQVLYGSTAANLDKHSDPIDASTGSATIELDGLSPKTDYYYQLVRVIGGSTGASETGHFKTDGYEILLSFINGDGSPISGVKGTLSDKQHNVVKSDENGDMAFTGLDDGSYDVSFALGGHSYKRTYDTSKAGDGSDTPGQPIVLQDVVNASHLAGAGDSKNGGSHGSAWPAILLILAIIVIGAGAFLWWRRRAIGTVAYGSYAAMTPDIVDLPTHKALSRIQKKTEPTGPPLQHVGESLPDMVMKAMHEEARKRKSG